MTGKSGHCPLLAGYRVLDLSDERAWFCARLLGDLGADVIKIEPPGGDPGRRLGPYFHDEPEPERSLRWFAYNANKRGVTLDLTGKAGRNSFLRLVRTADFVVESNPPGFLVSIQLDYPVLHAANPRLILVSISPFGQTGPYAQFKGPDLIAWAMGGILYASGDAGRAPVQVSFPQAYLQACAHGAVGALVAHYHRGTTGLGQHVDVSAQQAAALVNLDLPGYWDLLRVDHRRSGSRRVRTTAKGQVGLKFLHRCRDGHVLIQLRGGILGDKENQRLAEWMTAEGASVSGLEGTGWPAYNASQLEPAHADAIDRTLGAFFASQTRAQLYEGALEHGVLLVPVATPDDVLRNEQLAARQAWAKIVHPELGATLIYPGQWAKFSATPMSEWWRAPLIGEHNAEVLLPPSMDVDMTQGAPTCEPALSLSGNAGTRPGGGASAKAVFAGVKVVDFSWMFAGPLSTRVLADHGACVVRVECFAKPETARLSGPFKDNVPGLNRSAWPTIANANKYGVSLNLTHPLGREAAKRLVAWADLVGESFAPGTMERWGLDYQSLRRIRPDILMFSTSIQGQDGPFCTYRGFGSQTAAMAGFGHLTGWPDGDPVGPFGAYADLTSTLLLQVAVLAALDYRRRTGQGQYIDLSQLEASLPFLAPVLLDCAVNGRSQSRTGNRHPAASPHGVYPCRGDDCWCAIAVGSDLEWQALYRTMGGPAWAGTERFATVSGRKAHEDELDELISQWTAQLTPVEVMTMLQESGVPAAAVNHIADLFSDPQLAHRRHFVTLEHAEIGAHAYPTLAFQLSETPAEMKRAAPCLGQDNEFVYKELLGLSDDELADLIAAGAIY